MASIDPNVFPSAITIVIANTETEAHKLAEKELEPYFSGWPDRMGFECLGPLLFPPVPTTIFLCTKGAGRIK